MKRILIAEVKQETATFNPAKTRYDNFHVLTGQELITHFTGTDTELAGALDVFSEAGGIEVVPTISADSVSGGYIDQTDLDRILDEMVAAISENSNVDGAYLCLHGAMAGEENGDPEGTLIKRAREVLGPIPIVVSIDLHAVITDDMVQSADLIVPFHTYPHIDQYSTGQRAARNLLKLMAGEITPTLARVEIPMLVRGDELITATGRFGDAINLCLDVENSATGLAAGVIIGNAFTDVPALQSNVLVATDNDPDGAQQAAKKIAQFMWDNRELFQAELTSLEDAIAIANDTDGLTLFSDAADATASGAAGDSNAILKGLLKSDFKKTALMSIVDAPAVQQAFSAGVGAEIEINIGGLLDTGRFTPLPVTAYVKSLFDGRFYYENGTLGRGGKTAVLTLGGNISVLVTSRSVYVVGQKVYQSHGLEPTDFDVVVAKSPNGFRTHYESIASAIVAVDVPGSTSANLKSLPFEHCVRPIFPLDADVSFSM